MLFISVATGQTQSISISDFNHEDFPFHQSITCVLEDSEGLLWIGTDSGLYRYDGNDIKHYQYDVFDHTSIPNNSIVNIHEDNDHNIWIGTDSYLVRYSRTTDNFSGYSKGKVFTSFNESEKGILLAVTQNSIILDIKEESTVDQIYSDTIINEIGKETDGDKVIISEVKTDDFGKLWVGTNKGLFYIENSMLKPTGIHAPVNNILMSQDQIIWISSNSDVFKLAYSSKPEDLKILKKYSLSNIIGTKELLISSIIERSDKSIWIGSNKGLFKTIEKNGQLNFEKLSWNLGSVAINNLTEDRNGNLWIGSQKGLKKYVRNASIFNIVSLEGFDSSLHNVDVTDLYIDLENNIWPSVSKNILAKLDSKSKGRLSSYPTLETIIFIKPRLQKGKLWGIAENELFEIEDLLSDRPQITSFKKFDIRIDDVLEVDNNELWVCTWGDGIRIIDTIKDISEFKKDIIASTAEAYVSFIHKDRSDIIWIGTRGKGLYKINIEKKSIKQFHPNLESGITSNAFLSYCEDVNGDMWFGTRGGGLIYYERDVEHFRPFMSKNGLPSNTISALEQDHKNNIWMSTQNGIARLSFEDKSISSFGNLNGLEVTQFLFKSSTKSIDSKLIYFGFKGGYYEIVCDNYVPNTLVSATKIRSVKIYGKESQGMQIQTIVPLMEMEDGSIRLPHNKNSLAIEFSTSDLTAPSKNLIAYKLEGVNEYWIYPSNHTYKADYFDLNHGEYKFYVKSTNSDGIWNEEATTLDIIIKPPYWLSYWAYFFYGIIVLGLIYAFGIGYQRWYKLKKNLLKETVSREKDNQFHKLRMVFFTDIAHELRTPLTLILSSMEHFISKNLGNGTHKNATRIFNNTNKMKQLIDQIMDIRKHSEGEFKLKVKKYNAVQVINAIQANFSDLAKNNNIKLESRSSQQEILSFIDLSILEKIINNLLSNALKNTPEQGRISIDLSEVEFINPNEIPLELIPGRYIKIIIRDTGKGMNNNDLEHVFNRYYQAKENSEEHISGTGIGLELVSKLVILHRGHIIAESKVNEFTEFTVYLPAASYQYQAHEISIQQNLEDFEIEILKSSPSLVLPVGNNNGLLKKSNQEGRILFIDDNEEFRIMIKEQLEEDHIILTASDGISAMEIANSQKPDLIVCDIFMPGEDGMTFLKKIKSKNDLSHIPIIMLTGNTDEGSKKESIHHGAEDFIEKPFSLEFLKWKIYNTLQYQKSLKEIYSKKITTEPSSVELESPDERLIKDIIEIIEQNIASPNLSVEFLSSEVGMSRANLYRKTQKILNDTPVNLIKIMRLKRAKQIIELDKFYVAEVAEMTGFKSQRYFSTCFQKEYKITPMAYSKKKALEKTE